MKVFFIFFFIFIFQGLLFSQPQTEWVKRFNSPGNYNDYVSDMAIDKSGNVYLTGYLQINDTDQNFVTIKYNTQGIEQWVRYYDGPDHREDKPVSIAVDDSGNVIVAGSSYTILRSYDFLTIKYNKDGDSLWVRRYEDGLSISAMALDNVGNVYVTGNTIVADILTLKYNMGGELEWVRYYNGKGNGYDVPHSIITDFNCNVYINGFSFGSSGSVTLKYDIYGNEKWVKYYFANWYYIGIDSLSNIYCGGETIGRGFDYCVLKYDSLGNIAWVRIYDNGNATNINDNSREMCVDKSGNTGITGVNTTNALTFDIATIKYNLNGDSIWIRRFIGASFSNDESKSITNDKFGNVFICGFKDDGLFSKYLTIKYNSSGEFLWNITYDNSFPFGSHKANKILTDTLGNIYVTGVSQGNGTGNDIATLKYSQLTEVKYESQNISGDFILFQNYPNPFNPITKIYFTIPVKSNVKIIVYNNLGQIVKELLNEFKTTGSYIEEFNATNLSSGIYYYKIEAGNFAQVRKMILIK